VKTLKQTEPAWLHHVCPNQLCRGQCQHAIPILLLQLYDSAVVDLGDSDLLSGGKGRVVSIVDLVEPVEAKSRPSTPASNSLTRPRRYSRFDGVSNSLDTTEPPDRSLDQIPGAKDKDVSILHVSEGDGPGVGIDKTEQVDDDTGSRKTLGTSRRSQVFGRVDSLQRSVGEGVDNTEQVVGSESSLTVALVGDDDLACLGVLRSGGDKFGKTTVDTEEDGQDECTNRQDLDTRLSDQGGTRQQVRTPCRTEVIRHIRLTNLSANKAPVTPQMALRNDPPRFKAS
jgi:hypothetical protein